jgi:hypothetical protein
MQRAVCVCWLLLAHDHARARGVQRYAATINADVLEASAKTGRNVKEVFLGVSLSDRTAPTCALCSIAKCAGCANGV